MSFYTHEKTYRHAESRTPRVAIIGAGAGGICMAVAARRVGIREFTIFEQSDGIGGTWHDNVYPGAAVDTPVPFYSFSFHPFDFTRTHVTQAELLRYLQNVVDRFQLSPHIRLNTRVVKLVWDEDTHSYQVFTDDGESRRFDVVVSAVGLLNHPKYPDWPGLDTFEGAKFHSSRWDTAVDVTGKRIAVVGTGSSSAQLVPAIAADAAHLYVFQREPGWVMPKDDRDLTASERAAQLRRGARGWLRLRQGLTYERLYRVFVEGSRTNMATERAAKEYIDKVFHDRPDLGKLVMPNYPIGGKRIVRDSNFYPALLRDNVELVPHAVTKVTKTGIVDDTGTQREVDIIVMCTGFQPANFLATFEVVGRGGVTIHQAWNGTPEAYLGLTVAGFPNFYMMYGPNTNGAPIMFSHECQAAFVAANLKRMIRAGVTSIEVRKPVMDAYNWVIQRKLSRSVVVRHSQVHSYGRSASGRDVIAWPCRVSTYAVLTRTTARLSSRAQRRPPTS